jgi:DNA-binding MarR family transcriptional regulator
MHQGTYFQASDLTASAAQRTVAASGDVLELTRELAAFVIYLHKRFGRDYMAVLGELELSMSQFKAMHRLEDRGEMSVKELAAELGVSLPTASRAVDGLYQRGFVLRREDDVDRRMKRVELSEEGRTTLRELDALRFAGLVDFVAGLPADDSARLQAALEPIIDREDIQACLPHAIRQDLADEVAEQGGTPRPSG